MNDNDAIESTVITPPGLVGRGVAIRSLELIGLNYTLPPGATYGMSRNLTDRRPATLIELTTEDGVSGIGEAWGPPALNAPHLELLRGFYLGRSVFDHEIIWYDVISRAYHLGIQNPLIACLSGIDVAARDAIGKLLGVSLSELLGGRGRREVPVYASGGYFTQTGGLSLEQQLEPLPALGHRAAKIKIGHNPESDLDRVKRARQVLGEDFELLVDINGNYSVDQVLASQRLIAPYRIGWCEEPLPPQDFAGLTLLRDQATIPTATGEALYTTFDFNRLIETRSAPILQPDITLCGGLGQARLIALNALTHNLRISPHVWGSAVGLAAACHFVASLPNYPHGAHDPTPTLVEYDVGPNPLRDELLAAPLTASDGFITVPTGPGLGIELNPDTLTKYAVDG